ncbi:MAG TPA: histidine kinase [Streptosporangiaceae bacterium]|nr:histidine kinase [Streptosporangiaceae bacterium]
MATTLAQHQKTGSRYRPVPWSPRAWSQALYLTGGIPALLAAPVLVAAGFAAHPRAALPLLFLVVIFVALPVLTAMQRHRLRTTAGVDIPSQRPWTRTGLVRYARSPGTWRQFGYHLLAAPLLAAAALAALVTWLAGLVCTLVYAYAWTLNPESLLGHGQSWPPAHMHKLAVPLDVWVTLAGIALLTAAPRLTTAVADLDAGVARILLGPSRAEELQHRVEHLTQTRSGAVDAADAERRRLERDLHDGTQQRLVALAMRLGMARAEPAGATQAHQVIAEAHEDAKAALAELRNLIRGLHPAVLEDRGLDAALSGVAARMAIPVRLTVDMPRRPAATIEAVAYFVVSESLTNITKHAQASQAEVIVQRAGDRLHIIVSDDGVGGADPARGTGLTGLARRAQSVDGTFEVVSPPGGPTVLSVDLPCAR